MTEVLKQPVSVIADRGVSLVWNLSLSLNQPELLVENLGGCQPLLPNSGIDHKSVETDNIKERKERMEIQASQVVLTCLDQELRFDQTRFLEGPTKEQLPCHCRGCEI